MNTCDRCRYWQTVEGYDEPVGQCAITQSTIRHPFGEVDSLAVAQASRPTGAILLTRADFGCVQFALRSLTMDDILTLAPNASSLRDMEKLLDD